MKKARLIVEGHGEVLAAPVLMNRLWHHLGLSLDVLWDSPAIRSPGDLKRQDAMVKACELVRAKSDTALLLVLRDDEDGCPASSGPEAASWLRSLNLPFPSATVMAFREFETWFLPSVHTMAGVTHASGRLGLNIGTTFPNMNFEGRRDAKGWLTDNMLGSQRYKETVDQVEFTKLMDLQVVQNSGIDSFNVLCRALTALNQETAGFVYPG
jgi:hypothetical protein